MDYSTSELVKWLGEETRLLGWDLIFFIDGNTINTVLLQETIKRINTADQLPPISGYIKNGDGYRFALAKCGLQVPRLAFAVNRVGSKAHMQMAIVEANAYALKSTGNAWHVRQLDVLGPLQCANLSLDIDLAETGGAVDEDANITLDLSNTENFSLPCYSGETRLLTEFFRQKFSALTDEQRQLPIGRLPPGGVNLYRPVSFALRTQARGRTPTDVEGAVVVLVDTQDGVGGDYPGADYRYAIPNDGNYSATALFDTHRLLLAQMVNRLNTLITGAEFEDRQSGAGAPAVVCKAGYITFPQAIVEEVQTISALGTQWVVTGVYVLSEARIDMRDAVSIAKVGDHWELNITLRGSITAHFNDLRDPTGGIARWRGGEFSTRDFSQPVDTPFHYEASIEYGFEPEGNAHLYCLTFRPVARTPFKPRFGELKLRQTRDASVTASAFLNELLKPVISKLNAALEVRMCSLVSPDITGFQDVMVKKMKQDLVFSPLTGLLASTVLSLNFSWLFTGTNLLIPRDTAYFGRVNPVATVFTLSPLQSLQLPGTRQTFVIEPAPSVRWSAEAVSGLAADVQLSINNGVFTAPPASAMTKPFAQVLVTATNLLVPLIRRSALVTLVREALQANPAVVVAQPGSKVNFDAWVHGNPAALEWQYQNKDLGKGPTVTVTCPADLGTAAFVVEEVQVKDPESQQTSTCVLITEMARKIPMAVSANVDPAGAKAVLEARVNGNVIAPDKIDWDVLYGPGEATAGVYTPGNGDTARFALISATYDSSDFGIFEGYALLALPLAEHRDITTVQSD